MSASKHILNIKINEGYQYLVNISLQDAKFRPVEQQSSNDDGAEYKLEPGLYNFRMEMNGKIKEHVILLNGNKTVRIGMEDNDNGEEMLVKAPIQFSSAVLGSKENYQSTSESYLKPAQFWSSKYTFPMPDPNEPSSIHFNHKWSKKDSSLFIFLRFPTSSKYQDFKPNFYYPFHKDFELFNEFGESIYKFSDVDGVVLNDNDGWLAFNISLSPGIYYLVVNSESARQIPIYVYNWWHTQFFMTLGRHAPLYGTIRIFLSQERKFDADNPANQYIDILLNKLQNGSFIVGDKLKKIVGKMKWSSPILGLICSYMYLMSSETKSDQLFKEITRNLKDVILKNNELSPDLRALDILAAKHFPDGDYNDAPINGTPMFRVAFEAILNASKENSELFSNHSINHQVKWKVYGDSPFNTFKPIEFKETIYHG